MSPGGRYAHPTPAQLGPPRRTNSLPVDKPTRAIQMVVANAEPTSRGYKDDLDMIDVDSSSEYVDCGQQSQREQSEGVRKEDENTSFKNVTETFLAHREKVLGNSSVQKDLAVPEIQSDTGLNELREPREQKAMTGRPLPATPSQQRPVYAANPVAIAGARAAHSNSRPDDMPEEIHQAYLKLQSYYNSRGTTLEAAYAQQAPQNQYTYQQQQQLEQQQHQLQLQIQQQHQQLQQQQQQQQQQRGQSGGAWGFWGSGNGHDDHEVKNLKKQLESYKKERNLLMAEKSIAEDGKGKYKNKYLKLRDAYESLQVERQEQGESIRQAQDAVFDIMKKSASHAETDDKIRNSIESNLYFPVTDWSKDFGLSKELDAKVYSDPAFMELFSRVACKGVTPDCLSDLRPKQVPKLLAKAFLSYVVMTKIFDSPFFLLNLSPENNTRGAELEQLDVLRYKFVEADAKEGNKWRSQTVVAIERLIRAYDGGKGSHLLNISEAFATEFENSGARFVIEKRSEESHKALVEVFRKAGEMALRLWKYPTDMNSIGADLLGDDEFQVRSPKMKAHPSHKLDEYDTSMDGSGVALVLFPGVEANGNQEGERYGETKVWLKAEVRLGKPAATRLSVARPEEHRARKPTPPPPGPRRSEKTSRSGYRQ
ncbi:hypothetical protein BJ508DRAFT_413753 [Ascobolus immersus RN42]|uniref:Uncharacterized protein n=1 Tax=Ascobolus immersus RN42 TaxID=1160509 RepID=A0A3N4INE0_ASCIM|nr:hypothetical protein BJ508DRAFT_413753 [Ascobolus immersus RN42]